ncbi:hypothetical protein [Limobrevibacterium gyesilva]|uniref:Uncharacterized protein n=1 Tax=Limobrevibacterium gyesilva TaxID=2991712 RepID=A0AA41YLP4_9PROT|nr:hypothetical protein [Limobrevibacterium gyesilva]MCW3474990.1 hypothetical protein [Limobrevibacterium gyesilva]
MGEFDFDVVSDISEILSRRKPPESAEPAAPAAGGSAHAGTRTGSAGPAEEGRRQASPSR